MINYIRKQNERENVLCPCIFSTFIAIVAIIGIIYSSNSNNFKIYTDKFNVDFVLNGDYVNIENIDGQYTTSCTSLFNTTSINYCGYVLDQLNYGEQNAITYATKNCINGESLSGYFDPGTNQCYASSNIYPHLYKTDQNAAFGFSIVFLIVFGSGSLLLSLFLYVEYFMKNETLVPMHMSV